MYDLTNLTSANDFTGVLKFSNEVTGGLFFTLTMVAIFLILVMILKRWSFDVALLVSSFICAILSTIGWAGAFINTKVMIVFWAAFIGVSLYYFIVNRDF
jgi:hypothetical protein